MLQDIAPYSFCNDFAWINPEPTDRVLVYRGSSVLVSVDTTPQNASGEAREGTLRFPTFEMLSGIGAVVSDSAEIIQRADGMMPEAFSYSRLETPVTFVARQIATFSMN